VTPASHVICSQTLVYNKVTNRPNGKLYATVYNTLRFLLNTEAYLISMLELGCLCPVVVHNDYVVLDRHTHNTFTGTTILL
jgi:Fe2+ or Zn2+ uptake regulation protein